MPHQVRRGGRRLEHRAGRREVAAQDRDAAARGQRPIERTDDFGVPVRRVLAVLPDRLAVHRHRVADAADRAPPAHESRPARRPRSRNPPSGSGPTASGRRCVGTSRPRSSQSCSVSGTPMRPAIASRWMTALVDPPTAPFTRIAFSNAARVRICESRTSCSTISTMRRPAGAPARTAASRRPESPRCCGSVRPSASDHRRHRRRRAHDVARAGRSRHARLGLHELLLAHRAGLDVFAEAPDVGARAEVLAAELAVQHRAAGDDERGQVAARRAHDERRRRLVAAAEQHDAVDRVAANRLLDVHAGEIAEQHGGRAQARLAERHHRELERQPAGFPDAALHVLGELAEVRVARRQLRPGVADADDRPAVEDAFRQPAADPAAMNEPVLVRLAEPRRRSVRSFSSSMTTVAVMLRFTIASPSGAAASAAARAGVRS